MRHESILLFHGNVGGGDSVSLFTNELKKVESSLYNGIITLFNPFYVYLGSYIHYIYGKGHRQMISLYISLDFEGFSGISHAKHAFPSQPQDFQGYQVALKQVKKTLSQIFNALDDIESHRIVINDAHASMTNLFLADLDLPRSVELISGKPKRYGMMAGLDASFDACVLLGYHAKAGSLNAPLAHTFTEDMADICFNGISLGEAGLSILLAELGFGVPVLLTYGDDILGQELYALQERCLYLGQGIHVISKLGRGWQCVQGVPQAEAHLASAFKALCERSPSQNKQAKEALEHFTQARPLSDLEVSLQFHSPLMADACALLPHSERLNGTTVQLPLCFAEDTPLAVKIQEVYQSIQCAYSLALYAHHC
jgi:D-amino peptidase